MNSNDQFQILTCKNYPLYKNIYILQYIHTYIHIYIHIYIHTYIHTQHLPSHLLHCFCHGLWCQWSSCSQGEQSNDIKTVHGSIDHFLLKHDTKRQIVLESMICMACKSNQPSRRGPIVGHSCMVFHSQLEVVSWLSPLYTRRAITEGAGTIAKNVQHSSAQWYSIYRGVSDNGTAYISTMVQQISAQWYKFGVHALHSFSVMVLERCWQRSY